MTDETTKVPVVQTGTIAGGFPSATEIRERTRQFREYLDAVREFVKSVMAEGPDGDFGVIPGTQKRTLFQPGADKLMGLFGLRVSYDVTETEGSDGRYDVRVTAKLWHGETQIGESTARASSYESKWRYRFGSRACPSCGRETIRKGKAEWGGGWYCHAKAGGCGAKFRDTDPAITEQEVGKIQNADIVDVYNTVLQVAQKRAKVAAVRTALRLTDMFTQDIGEEEVPQSEGTPLPEPTERAANGNGKTESLTVGAILSALQEAGITQAKAVKWAHEKYGVSRLTQLSPGQFDSLIAELRG